MTDEKKITTTLRMREEVETEARRRIRRHGDLSAMITEAVADSTFGETQFLPEEELGRPRAPSSGRLTSVYLSVATRTAIKALAAAHSVSENTVMNAALRRWFKTQKRPK